MRVLEYILDLLYPPRCFLCGKILREWEKATCHKCTKELPRLKVEECRRDIRNIRLCVSAFRYKDSVRDSLHRYKFKAAAAYGPVYADFIAKSIDENGISCDIISWVPLSKRRLRKRGYDQAEIIARELSDKLGVPCVRLLIKHKDNRPQSSIKRPEARKANVAGVYRCVPGTELTGKRVLLVDDIVTTGSTLSECAAMLKDKGCNAIYAASVATAQ